MVLVHIIDDRTGQKIHEFKGAVDNIPERGDYVWVPDDGDVQWQVLRREREIDDNIVRLICGKDPDATK